MSAKDKPDLVTATKIAKMIAATMVVTAALRTSIGFAGALESDPVTMSPLSACVLTPKGKIANRTIHQMTKYIAIDMGIEYPKIIRHRLRRKI